MHGQFMRNTDWKQDALGWAGTLMRSLAVALITACLPFSVAAQQASAPSNAPIKRTPLQTFDVPGTQYQTVIGLAEIVSNVNIGRHTHPGAESGYIIEGDFVLLVQGQPDKPLKAGESYQVAPGVPHDARTGEKGAKVLATYVVEKGKPLATPTP